MHYLFALLGKSTKNIRNIFKTVITNTLTKSLSDSSRVTRVNTRFLVRY